MVNRVRKSLKRSAPKNPVGRPLGDGSKKRRSHWFTPEAHQWIKKNKLWIEESARSGRIVWNREQIKQESQ